uniref:Lipoprotein n=1 Tax=Anguilla anguilla TaxID=7936 RepID=A0A0E9THC9_ANGAN
MIGRGICFASVIGCIISFACAKRYEIPSLPVSHFVYKYLF